MSNTTVRLLIGSGVATTGALLIYAKVRSRNRWPSTRTRKQADILKRQAAKLGESAADDLADAIKAGKAAYHRVADQVAERVAG